MLFFKSEFQIYPSLLLRSDLNDFYVHDLILAPPMLPQGGNDFEIYESERTVGHTGIPFLICRKFKVLCLFRWNWILILFAFPTFVYAATHWSNHLPSLDSDQPRRYRRAVCISFPQEVDWWPRALYISHDSNNQFSQNPIFVFL